MKNSPQDIRQAAVKENQSHDFASDFYFKQVICSFSKLDFPTTDELIGYSRCSQLFYIRSIFLHPKETVFSPVSRSFSSTGGVLSL